MAYITTTHLLERIHPKTLVVNNPAAVRNAPEKVFVLDFLDLMPPTLVTRSPEAIKAFRDKHKDIVVKPLYGNGGAAVFRIPQGDTNLNSLIELLGMTFREPIMVQRYLPEVRGGDKRIILVDGEIAGAINRVPAPDETRSNLHVGGRAEPATLTARDKEICARLGPELKKRGLIFVGIDVIGDYLTEINVTSPTGIRQIAQFGGNDIAAMIWDVIEAKVPGSGSDDGEEQDVRRGVRRPHLRRVSDARHRGDHGDHGRRAARHPRPDHDRRPWPRRRAQVLRDLVHRQMAGRHRGHIAVAHHRRDRARRRTDHQLHPRLRDAGVAARLRRRDESRAPPVVAVGFARTTRFTQRIYWDQASMLVHSGCSIMRRCRLGMSRPRGCSIPSFRPTR